MTNPKDVTPAGGASRAWILDNLSELVTCVSADPESVRRGVAVGVADGRVAAIAALPELRSRLPDAPVLDGAGGVLTPGFVDSHSHAVFGAYRAHEFGLRTRGVPYMEIARRGGGIVASVRHVRALSEDALVELTLPRLSECLRYGTTTLEVKSGYGLTVADELKMLRAIRRLDRAQPVDLVPTFLGAHAVPPEYRERRDRYVELVIQEMIPAVAAGGLARFCDVFLEPGVFDREEARRILEAGMAHGLAPKLHADELENSGGAELAAELGAVSADHLGAISEAGIQALAGSSTVATLLPATLLLLGRRTYAPARRLADAGATLALATDFNPGSSPAPGLPLILTLACSQMGLDPLEAVVAATRGGAQALRLEDGRGTITAGAPADLVLWRVPDHREIPYHVGVNRVSTVWKRGTPVVSG
ncbi:MAG: imidazolonepropionase [Gemmatimonadetes bacterium]|nr:imidazolonepropionase [Gemmatimonadota bacterium]